MAVLVEEVVDGDDTEDTPSLDTLLEQIAVPPEYARYSVIEDRAVIEKLVLWKTRVIDTLRSVQKLLQQRSETTRAESARVACAVAPFLSESDWSSTGAISVAEGILDGFEPDVPLLEEVFAVQIKPVFQSAPHPLLNTNTGRKLVRPAGGPVGSHDMYEGQVWKSYPRISSAVLWCVQRIPADAYERLWYLVIPPVMTMLDDYEIKYKLEAVTIVRALLESAPPELLRRTGVADLLFDSLKRSLTLLHSPETPAMIRSAMPTAVDLILRTAEDGSELRFARLCELLGDCIIGSVWMYGYQDAEAIEASAEVIPVLVNALGIGAARYLKALIPQLVHPLEPNPDKPLRRALQLASMRALLCVIQQCAERMYRWKGTVLAAVIKCWVTMADVGDNDSESNELRKYIKEVCAELEKATPSAREDFDRILALDQDMFSGLFGSGSGVK